MADSSSPLVKIAQHAEAERSRVFHQDVLGQKEIHMQPMSEEAIGGELTRFATELWAMPNMDGYFDRRHLSNLRQHQREAQHGFATLAGSGIIEIISVPSMPDQVMGFHLFVVFDPRDDQDRGRFIGYTIWSLERGQAPFGQAEAVRMAFDIFPPYREHRYKKVAFTNHDIYNISRRALYHFRPQRFLVDVTTQIAQTRTGRNVKRAIYYLKRGYYPPDQKQLADSCLVRLTRHQPVSERTLRRLIRSSKAPYWIFPADQYLRLNPAGIPRGRIGRSRHGLLEN
jgi:hypothetical protein